MSFILTCIVFISLQTLGNGAWPVALNYTKTVHMDNLVHVVHQFLGIEANNMASCGVSDGLNAMHDILLAIGTHFPNKDGNYKIVQTQVLKLANIFQNKAKTQDSSHDWEIDECRHIILKKFPSVTFVGNYINLGDIAAYHPALWHLFHVMTFNLYKSNPNGDATLLLAAIKGYATKISRCVECAEHYTEMTAGSEGETYTARNACLHLWKLHNMVTHHVLSLNLNAAKEIDLPWIDGLCPIYFPQIEIEPQCYDGRNPNMDRIFTFLKDIYTVNGF